MSHTLQKPAEDPDNLEIEDQPEWTAWVGVQVSDDAAHVVPVCLRNYLTYYEAMAVADIAQQTRPNVVFAAVRLSRNLEAALLSAGCEVTP